MKKPVIFLTLLLLTNVPSLYWQLYIHYNWLDSTQHFLGGFFVAMLCWAYFKNYLPDDKLKNLILIVGATALVGVFWEFAEYIANQTLIDPFYRWFGIRAYFMGNLEDTMIDLLLDISGAFAYFVVFARKK